MQDADLIRLPARTVVDLLANGTISPLDCIDVLERRIAAVDTKVNALPVLCLERARERARQLMRQPPERRGRLAGLPLPIKDLTAVEGVRTTHGSTIFATDVPRASDVLVEHLERQGAVVYAKSNTPEFGAGANTFNDVFGRTLNPWNTSRSAAGSSGGAAVALATGMAWLAHGSDMGGSLRNPASFCGVVGLRPSPGRVARSRSAALGGLLSVEGPMARDVEDVALLLDAMAGAERRDPSSLPADGTSFLAAARGGPLPRRVAFSRDLGITPVEPEVARMVEAAARSSPAPASSSRKRIPISARRMTASRCCGRCPSRPGSRMCRGAWRPAQAGDRVEYREGPQAFGRGDHRGGAAAGRHVRPHGSILRDL